MLDGYRTRPRPARRRRANARPDRRRRSRGGAKRTTHATTAPASADIGQVLASIAPGPARPRPRSRDLADELDADRRGTLTTWRVDGHAELIEVLHYPAAWLDDPDPDRGPWLQPARGGIDTGTGAHWTDAETPREALARFLTGRMR